MTLSHVWCPASKELCLRAGRKMDMGLSSVQTRSLVLLRETKPIAASSHRSSSFSKAVLRAPRESMLGVAQSVAMQTELSAGSPPCPQPCLRSQAPLDHHRHHPHHDRWFLLDPSRASCAAWCFAGIISECCSPHEEPEIQRHLNMPGRGRKASEFWGWRAHPPQG